MQTFACTVPLPMVFEYLDLYIDEQPREGALNMAIDEALARSITTPTLRVYGWAVPSVSFGYFGRHGEVVARWPGRVPVRRWTGGGEVPHGEDFTYTVLVPATHPFSRVNVRDSYHALHSALAPLLPGGTLASGDAPDAPMCFARPVVADVLVGGRKVAGAAQRRGNFGLLHQGSVQGTLWPPELAGSLAHALARNVAVRELSSDVLREAARLCELRYGTEAWLTRR